MVLVVAFIFLQFAITSTLAETDVPLRGEDTLAQTFLDALSSKDYDPRVPPAGASGYGSPVEVKATMFILDVSKFDDLSMDFRVQFYFRQKWNDSRLVYEDEEVNFKEIYVKEIENIWKPDLFFVQEREGEMHKITMPNVFMKISPTGEVHYSIRLSIVFHCRMDLRKFPFDTQKCLFNIESYGYTTDKILLSWNDGQGFKPLSFSDSINMLDFELADVTPSVRETRLNDAKYTALQVNLTFNRKTGFFVIRLFIPFALLVLVSWLSFWINPKFVSMRLTILLAVLYLVVTIGIDVNQHIAPASYTKGSDVWIGVCQSLVFGALLEFILVSLLSRKETKLKCKSIEENIFDLEGKKTTPFKGDSLNSSEKFVAMTFCLENKCSARLDFVSRILFPLLFVFFNVVYWSVYSME